MEIRMVRMRYLHGCVWKYSKVDVEDGYHIECAKQSMHPTKQVIFMMHELYTSVKLLLKWQIKQNYPCAMFVIVLYITFRISI